MPQGSVLGLTLFIIYVNDLVSDLLSKVPKFADNIKVFGKILCTEYCSKNLDVFQQAIKLKWEMVDVI